MKYSKEEKWVIMNTTQTNYANILKRITKRMRFGNFILTYYSIVLIIFALTSKYYGNSIDKEFLEFISIVISVIMLTFSIINSNADYQIRIDKIRYSMDQVKKLKRMLSKPKITLDEINKIDKEYNEVSSQAEVRSELDFYVTVRNLRKECLNIKKINKEKNGEEGLDENKIDEIQKEKLVQYYNDINDLWLQRILYYGEYIIYILLIVVPVIILIKSGCFIKCI